MDKLLDILGATVLWSFIILILLRVNIQMTDNSFENLNTSITQMNAIELGKIFEFDFPNAGHLITGNKIITADSSEFEFYFDYNQDGSKDSLKYFLGTTSNLIQTLNPNDKPLYRHFNGTTTIIGEVSNLKLNYLDSSGAQISYASLSTQTARNKIKTIEIYFLKESGFKNYDELYPALEWERKISPNNL